MRLIAQVGHYDDSVLISKISLNDFHLITFTEGKKEVELGVA